MKFPKIFLCINNIKFINERFTKTMFNCISRIFTYASLALAVAIGILIKNFKFSEILVSGITSSICFFVITNFGAWLTLEMYEKNLSGLINSYVLAIPFFHNTLISTLVYLILIKLLFNYVFEKKSLQQM